MTWPARSVALLGLLGVAAAPVGGPPGASSCSGCHSPAEAVGAPVPHLTGLSAEQIAGSMAAYRTGERAGTVMGRIARGFSEEESRAIAEWIVQPDRRP